MSLVVCTILYMLFAHVMTGVVHYSAFAGQNGIAPVAIAIDHMGQMDASGVIRPDYPWMNRAIVIAILLGVLLGYHGNVIRTEPCILEYEPGWAAPSPIFPYP